MNKLTHTDDTGALAMVDISEKLPSKRRAIAKGTVHLLPETLKLIEQNQIKKGDVLATAKIAGIMAGKKTADLIPLCHPLPLDQINVALTLNHDKSCVDIEAVAVTTHKTGVEMEALTAVSIAGLTIYDMCKGVEKGIRISDIHLAYKEGGKSGKWSST